MPQSLSVTEHTVVLYERLFLAAECDDSKAIITVLLKSNGDASTHLQGQTGAGVDVVALSEQHATCLQQQRCAVALPPRARGSSCLAAVPLAAPACIKYIFEPFLPTQESQLLSSNRMEHSIACLELPWPERSALWHSGVAVQQRREETLSRDIWSLPGL